MLFFVTLVIVTVPIVIIFLVETLDTKKSSYSSSGAVENFPEWFYAFAAAMFYSM